MRQLIINAFHVGFVLTIDHIKKIILYAHAQPKIVIRRKYLWHDISAVD
jgi:hypothetical protein